MSTCMPVLNCSNKSVHGVEQICLCQITTFKCNIIKLLKERLIYITENCLFQVYHHCVAPDSGHDNKTHLTASPESVMSTVMTVLFPEKLTNNMVETSTLKSQLETKQCFSWLRQSKIRMAAFFQQGKITGCPVATLDFFVLFFFCWRHIANSYDYQQHLITQMLSIQHPGERPPFST